MRRVVIPKDTIAGEEVRLSGALHHHLCRVLRLSAGAELLLVEESGAEHRGRIEAISRKEVLITIEEHVPRSTAPRPRLVLIYGISRRSRTEWVLQKATELGVDSIVLARCERSVFRPPAHGSKLDRWREILRQAARQSARSTLPGLSPPLSLREALASAGSAELRLLASPDAQPLFRLAQRLVPPPSEVALVVGPEGGFSDLELEIAVQLGFLPVGLGPLVLRTETAAIALLALTAYLTGRLDEVPSKARDPEGPEDAEEPEDAENAEEPDEPDEGE
jgi:16S rRNA (uracil1498-N3)-methyltransferase